MEFLTAHGKEVPRSLGDLGMEEFLRLEAECLKVSVFFQRCKQR